MDPKDFRGEYERMCMPLGMYALRFVGNVDDAQDIVQGAFMAAWQRVIKGEDIQNFKAYMYRAVHNAAMAYLRQRQNISDVAYNELDEVKEVSEEAIDTAERDAALWKAIDSLPNRCREIFLMSKRDGMSNVAIAEELGISVKTVENQMTKAFSALRGNPDLRLGKVFFLPFL
ncbi:MAG: RNA polymerase sigma-70 factor [Muribaculaceae bacterium]|nr:RNA polymerase sigma-70 factor [Muribaculaceae bacterium]